MGREIDAGRGDPIFGAFPIRESGDSTMRVASAVDEVQNSFHGRGPFADNDGAADRFLGIRRRGHQPLDDGFAHARLRDGVEIPDAIKGGIKSRVRDQLFARAEKFLIRDHALAGGIGEPSLRVDGNSDRHGKEKT